MLIHEKIATVFLPDIAKKLHDAKVEIRGCDRTYKILKNIKQATDEDFYNEYLDLILNIKVVNSLDDAIAHMAKYGSNHSDAIVTDNDANALRCGHVQDRSRGSPRSATLHNSTWESTASAGSIVLD